MSGDAAKVPWWKNSHILVPGVIVPILVALIPAILSSSGDSDGPPESPPMASGQALVTTTSEAPGQVGGPPPSSTDAAIPGGPGAISALVRLASDQGVDLDADFAVAIAFGVPSVDVSAYGSGGLAYARPMSPDVGVANGAFERCTQASRDGSQFATVDFTLGSGEARCGTTTDGGIFWLRGTTRTQPDSHVEFFVVLWPSR